MSPVSGFILAAVLAALATAPPAEPLPQPAVQAQIEKAVAAVVRQDAGAQEEIQALAPLARAGRKDLVLQLALYLERAKGTEQSMAGALIVRSLAFTSDEMLDAVEPHLLGARSELRHVFTEMLATIDRSEGGAPDFGIYEERIRRMGAAPPQGLIKYMFELSPDAALASMDRVFGGVAPPGPATSEDIAAIRGVLEKPLSPQNDRARARAALDAMSRDTVWWRRLYAAAVLRAQPSLATAAIAARLQGDSHTLVRMTANAPAP